MAAAKLPRDPLHTPPARPQAQHLRHIVRRLHHLPPWISPRQAFRDSFLAHSISPRLSKEGAIPRDAEGAIFHGARHADHRTPIKQHSKLPILRSDPIDLDPAMDLVQRNQ
ncbi:hypothetical protein MesoLjLb_14860 [Mesorhizobium sp. L-8-3]|nr:hypothetical protein MesoLjLb_14860 [Mesorhizobium sp. L-8-3]